MHNREEFLQYVGDVNKEYQNLKDSQKESMKDYWNKVYKKYFNDPNLTVDMIIPCGKGIDKGYDKIITLSNGRQIKMEEKFHKSRGGKYQDDSIFIETHHEYDNGNVTPGWIKDKTKQADYLAYAKVDMNAVYIFPFRELQEVCEEFEDIIESDPDTRSFSTRNNNCPTKDNYTTKGYLCSAATLYSYMWSRSINPVSSWE